LERKSSFIRSAWRRRRGAQGRLLACVGVGVGLVMGGAVTARAQTPAAIVDQALELAGGGAVEVAAGMLDDYLAIAGAGMPDAVVFEVLLARVRMALEFGEPAAAVEEEIFRLLDVVRQMESLRGYAAEVHELHAQWLLRAGFPEGAVAALERAYRGALGAGRPAAAFDDLAAIAEIYRHGGKYRELHRTVLRGRVLAAEHPGVPLSETASARMEALGREAEENLQAVLGRGRHRDLAALEGTGDLAVAAAPAAGVDLQPLASTTAVRMDEWARNRATLTNPSTLPRTGRLIVETAGGTPVQSWRDSGGEIEIVIGGERMGADPAESLTLGPGEMVMVYLAASAASAPPGANRYALEADLVWADDAGESRSRFQFVFRGDRRPAAIVTASDVRLHPLYAVPLYTEIYHRHPGERVHDLRFVSSSGSRVEIRDAGTSRLLAVDADGDGDFRGPGDQVFDDANSNGLPDVLLDSRQNVAALEVFVSLSGREADAGDGDGDGASDGAGELVVTFAAATAGSGAGQKWKERDRNINRVRWRAFP